MFWQAFFQLFSSTYRKKTLCLGGILLFSTAIQFYLSVYVPSTVLRIENDKFTASRLIVANQTIEDKIYDKSIENVEYVDVNFVNCSFNSLTMSHVTFTNCTLSSVSMLNVKCSKTVFKGAYFYNSNIIDTDIVVGRELDAACVLNETTIRRGMRSACEHRADLVPGLAPLVSEHAYVAYAGLLAAILGPPLYALCDTVIFCLGCTVLSPLILWAESETLLFWTEAIFRVFLTLIYYAVAISCVQEFPCNLRCCAHGLVLAGAGLGAALVRGVAGHAGPALAASCTVLALGAGALGSSLCLHLVKK